MKAARTCSRFLTVTTFATRACLAVRSLRCFVPLSYQLPYLSVIGATILHMQLDLHTRLGHCFHYCGVVAKITT